jgi:hypothetical protein
MITEWLISHVKLLHRWQESREQRRTERRLKEAAQLAGVRRNEEASRSQPLLNSDAQAPYAVLRNAFSVAEISMAEGSRPTPRRLGLGPLVDNLPPKSSNIRTEFYAPDRSSEDSVRPPPMGIVSPKWA